MEVEAEWDMVAVAVIHSSSSSSSGCQLILTVTTTMSPGVCQGSSCEGCWESTENGRFL
jgi:hypothetical protein